MRNSGRVNNLNGICVTAKYSNHGWKYFKFVRTERRSKDPGVEKKTSMKPQVKEIEN